MGEKERWNDKEHEKDKRCYLFPPHSRPLSHPSSLSPPKHPSSFGEKEKGTEKQNEKDQNGVPSFSLTRMAFLILLLFLLLSLPFPPEKKKQREKWKKKGCEKG